MYNVNPETGVRYGVISGNSIDPDVLHELMWGPQSVNETYEEAYADAKREAGAKFDEVFDEAMHIVEEQGIAASTRKGAELIEIHLEKHCNGYCDRDEYIDAALEQFSDTYTDNEPVITGTYEGVRYRISWLGGAPLLWVIRNSDFVVYANSLCSPCVPNAADLDSGFAEYRGGSDGGHHECYGVPLDWLSDTFTFKRRAA